MGGSRVALRAEVECSGRMQITAARRSDMPEIVALWHSGWHQAHAALVAPALVASRTRAEFERRTAARLGQTQVARAEGRIAGFFMLEADELYQFYVGEAFQGQGVAGALMAAAEAALGPGPAWLACTVGNERAARFYEKCGWRRGAVSRYDVEADTQAVTVKVWRFEKLLGRSVHRPEEGDAAPRR